MSGEKHDPCPNDPREDLRSLPPAELERRARAHVQCLREEMAGLKDDVEKNFRPAAMARKHPLVVAGMGATLGFWLLRKLRGRRPPEVTKTPEPDKPVSPKHVFRHSLLSSLAKVAGTALPAALVWGIKRHAGARGKRRMNDE